MKIAFILDSFPKVSETFVLNQILSLIDAGVDISIFVLNKSKENIIHEKYHEYELINKTTYAVRMPDNTIIKYMKGLLIFLKYFMFKPLVVFKLLNFYKYNREAINLRLLYYSYMFYKKDNNFDIIHAHFGPIGNIAVKLLETKAIKGKLVTTFHGYDINKHEIISKPNFYKKLIKRGNLFIVNSRFAFEKLLKIGFLKEKIQILPNPIDCDFFKNIDKSFYNTDDILNVLTVGRLSEEKGHIYSLDAIKILLDKGFKIKYDIVGSGLLFDNLNNFIVKNKLQENIILHGSKNQNEILEFYKNADIFLLPALVSSTNEVDTQAIVLQEAQAMKLPVVTTFVGGIPEGVVQNETGFLIEQRNYKEIVKIIIFLIENYENIKIMGMNGPKYIYKKYNNDVVTKKTLECYRTLLV